MNGYYNEDEVEINIKDLISFLLKRWVIILIAAIVGCVLGAGYKYTSGKDDSAGKVEISEEEQAKFDEAMEFYEIQNDGVSRNYSLAQDLITKQTEYMNGSIMLQIDPYHVAYSQKDYQFEIEGSDYKNPSNTIGEYFKEGITYGDKIGDIAKSIGSEDMYVRELFGISYWSPALIDPAEASETDTGAAAPEYTYVLNMTVYSYGTDTEMSEKILSGLIEEFDALDKKGISGIKYTVTEIDETSGYTVDLGLRDKQQTVLQRGAEVYNYINNIRNSNANLAEPKSEDYFEAGTEPVSKKDILKFGLIGLLAGIFISAGIYVLMYVMGPKIATVTQFEANYPKVRLLGSKDNMITVNVSNYAGQSKAEGKDIKKILVIGGIGGEALTEKTEMLSKALKEYEFITAEDVVMDSDSREKLLSCDAIVMIEQKGVSRYDYISQELELIGNMKKTLIGAAVVE